jgi:Flp pilus assembly pilin Flp
MSMKGLMTALGRFVRGNDGQDLLEYALLVALIALVAIAGVTTVGQSVYDLFWRNIGQAI